MGSTPYWIDGVGSARSSDTSQAVATALRSVLLTKREKVMAIVRAAAPGSMTVEEVEQATGWGRINVGPRLAELHAMGKIADSGERRRNSSGHLATAWTLPQFAPEAERLKAEKLAQEEQEKLNKAWSIAERLGWLEAMLAEKADVLGGDTQLVAGAELAGETRTLIRKRILKLREEAA